MSQLEKTFIITESQLKQLVEQDNKIKFGAWTGEYDYYGEFILDFKTFEVNAISSAIEIDEILKDVIRSPVK